MAEDLALYEVEVKNYFTSLPDSAFEDGHCPFIHSQHPKHIDLFTKGTMVVSRCECDFVYNRIQPTQTTLDKFYAQSEAMSQWAGIKNTDKENIRQRQKFGWVVDYLTNMGVKSVLDLGCGTGKFLTMLKKSIPKAELVGVDQNAPSLSSQSGITFNHESIYQFLENDRNTYEAISLWGVLEHVKDPINLLVQIKQRLTGPKLVIVCVPNVESEIVLRTWEKCFTFCPQHLWYFSRSTLERAFYMAGLTVRVHHTIEPESIPVIKHSKGLDPYKPLPSWAKEQIISQSVVDHLDTTIIDKGLGYKVVAIGVPR